MHWIDWTIVAATLLMIFSVAFGVKKYMVSVADFLTANRCAGRYLLTTAEGAAAFGAMSVAASFEKFYTGGLGAAWWGTILEPVMLVLALSGFVIYRYRQTRAMTFAQFFEMRYSRRFRVYAGLLAWVAGMLTYGVFPGVTARFLIYFCQIPQYYTHIGSVQINLTLAGIMFVLLSIALTLALTGGQIAIMVSDFVQGQFFNIAFLVMMLFLAFKFPWSHLVRILETAPPGKSMINPFKQQSNDEFGAGFYFIQAFMMIYGYKAWQNNVGYRAAARTPHEARMAGILAGWRGIVAYMMMILAPLCVYVVMHDPSLKTLAQPVQATVKSISDPALKKQLVVPVALTHMLPVGIVGLMAAALIAAGIATDDASMHSWGSIFIQDIVLPIRGGEMTPVQHLRWLRFSIFGVAVFAFFFSMFFPIQERLIMFLAATHAVFLGGAGVVVIGGLYWRRGTTLAAYAALTLGSFLALTGFLSNNLIWPKYVPAWKAAHPASTMLQSLPDKFWFNGNQITFVAAMSSIAVYVLISLCNRRQLFDLDRMLHRQPGTFDPAQPKMVEQASWKRRLGISPEFTRGDKAIYIFKVVWAGFWFVTFVIGTAWGYFGHPSDAVWANWWAFRLTVTGIVCLFTVVWFLWGGIIDLRSLFRDLSHARRSMLDDGTVRVDLHEPEKPGEEAIELASVGAGK